MPNSRLALLLLPWWLAFAACSNPSAGPAAAGTAAPVSQAARGAGNVQPPPMAEPRDAYVLLSGGGTPLSNHYSQYVQAKAIAGYLERACPPERTWVFFGAGNREGEPPVLADVRREFTRDGLAVQSWLPGALRNNRPATRESFLRALREEILPVVHGGGTLFLWVGDHGELVGGRGKEESAITLWQLKRGARRRAGNWIVDTREVLGVAELRQVLAAGLGRGRVVFCMTQCHGGGFHELGISREMVPPRSWFAGGPRDAPAGATGLRLPIAGYTATDELSPAAGCEANPDPLYWAGYERFMPEALLGIDLMTGAPKGRPADTLAAAHEAATLVDETIDKPRSTSEHFLAAWAEAIETKLARTLGVTPKVAEAVAAYHASVERGLAGGGPGELGWRQAQYARFVATLATQAPAEARLLQSGSRKELEAAVAPPERRERGGGGRRRGAMAELRRLWNDTLRPAWTQAVLAGRVGGLTGAALQFERHLLAQEEEGRNLLLGRPGGESPLLDAMYWYAGYATPATFDPVAAAEITRWGAERRLRIVGWAETSADAAVRAAAARIGLGPSVEPPGPHRMSRETAAARVLFYRRVLAAWEFLLRVDAQPALAELQVLLDLERTPLPVAAHSASGL